MPNFRYYAMRQLRRGLDPETGEQIYFQAGEEIPATQFGSSSALQADIHLGRVAAVPIAETGVAPETIGDPQNMPVATARRGR